MRSTTVALITTVGLLTACSNGCFGDAAPAADERLVDEWEVDGESYTIDSGFEAPKIVRAGQDTTFQVYLPPLTADVYGTTVADPDTTCLDEYPCTPGSDWTRLEFDDETKSWRGDVPVEEDLRNETAQGARASSTVIYRAPETRFDLVNKSIVVASEANDIRWVASPDDVSALCSSDPCLVSGDLYVSEWSGADISAVSRVASVSGDLVVSWNDEIEDLDGVHEIQVDGYMKVFANPELRTLDPLGPTVPVSGLWLSSLPSLTTPLGLSFELPLSRDRQKRPRYRYVSVPVVSDVLASFPNGAEVELRGQLGTTSIGGDEETFLRSISIAGTDVERIELPAASSVSVSENEAMTELVVAPSERMEPRPASISDNAALESIAISHDGPVQLTVSDSPRLDTISGLNELHPDSRLNLYRTPLMRRCELEDALPPEVIERSVFDEIGECD